MSHDVFISYAHRDNVPCCGDEQNRWIKRLHKALSNDLSTRLGRDADVFYDKKNIKDGDLFKNSIKDALKDSATILVVLSPSWANSDPCNSEYRYYQNHRGNADSYTLIIESLDIDPEDWNELKKLFRRLDLIHRRIFYKKEENGPTRTFGVHEDEPTFYHETSDLGWMIKSKLAQAKGPPDPNEKKVFIYSATEGLSDTSRDHLLQLQSELRDHLDEKLSVGLMLRDWLTNDSPYEDDGVRELALTEEIRLCDHFVQLVTKNIRGQVNAATQALAIAKEVKKPFSVWSAAVTDNEEITFSGSFESFKQEVLSYLQTADAKTEDSGLQCESECYAYIDRGDDYDASKLIELVDELQRQDIETVPEKSEDDIGILEQALRDPACNAIITIRRGNRPNILKARIDSELDQQIAVHKKGRPIQRIILNLCDLENDQVSEEVASSEWDIINTAKELMSKVQVKKIRYNIYSNE